MAGLGPLSYEAQRGMYLHPTYAVTPGRVPLGVIDAWMWAREFKDKDGNRPGLCESVRWIEGYERVAEQADRMMAAAQTATEALVMLGITLVIFLPIVLATAWQTRRQAARAA